MPKTEASDSTPWAAIETAMLKLPATPAPPDAIPYANTIPGAARELYLMGTYRDTRRASDENTTLTGVESEVTKVQIQAERLLRTIEGLHKNTIDALNFRPEALRALSSTLRILSASAKIAKVPAAPSSTAQGRPPTRSARQTAVRAAEHYRGITGKMPTPTIGGEGGAANDSPFVTLLRVVFETCGITASLEVNSKKAVEIITEKNRRK